MQIVLSLRKFGFAALFALLAALTLLPASSFASDAEVASWPSDPQDAVAHDECLASEMPMHSKTVGGMGLDCCQWTSAMDAPALPLPNGGGQSALAPARALPAIQTARTSDLHHPPAVVAAAGPSLILLFGRFRE